MANRLTMAEIDAILTLHTTRHSNREIATLLGKDRETVGKYVARAKAQNRPNAPIGREAGSGDRNDVAVQNQPNAPTGSEGPPASGPPSECEPFREQILAKVEQGLEAVRIHQDLVEDHREIAPSYYSVRRFIARLRRKTPLPFRRMETAPGEEAQVDFDSGALVRMADGKFRRWDIRTSFIYRFMSWVETEGYVLFEGRITRDTRAC
jgi:hypothetical protein